MDDTTGRLTAPADLDPALPGEVEVRAVEIRAEIADTREDMSETIDAIQQRLSPERLKDQAATAVRNATTEKVKKMANTAGDANHIIPITMIGVGAAWLLMNRRSDRRGDYDDWGYPRRYGRETYGSDRAVGTRGRVDTLTSQAQDKAEQWRDTAEHATRRARGRFEQVLNNNPLMLGAAAAIVGAVVGMSVPESDVENEWMGEARDSVVEGAREMASEAKDKAIDQAKNMASNLTGQ
jgi:ElaB/YqjD/DUF883 family membrane-anchored ribosome-binding protein